MDFALKLEMVLRHVSVKFEVVKWIGIVMEIVERKKLAKYIQMATQHSVRLSKKYSGGKTFL